MREYAITLICVCALSALACLIFEGQASQKAVKAATGVLLLYAIISPLPALISGFDISELMGEPVRYGDAFSETCEEGLCEGIREAVAREFSLERENISVSICGFDASAVRAQKIRVVLSGDALTADHRKIREYVNGLSLGECEVNISYG